jgi:hypothetical protein
VDVDLDQTLEASEDKQWRPEERTRADVRRGSGADEGWEKSDENDDGP